MGKAEATSSIYNLHRLSRNASLRKPTVNEMTKESEDSLIRCQHRCLERSIGHFMDLFTWSVLILGLLSMPASETMQWDTDPVSEIEVVMKTSFLTEYNVAGPDKLCPSFFKDGDDVLTLELTNCLDKSKYWCESIIATTFRKHYAPSAVIDQRSGISSSEVGIALHLRKWIVGSR